MSVIHPSAAEGFAKKSETYMRGRPDYPAEVDDWLRGDLGMGPSSAVLDLGSGTGIFTRRLLDTRARVIAVEPVPEMLEKLTRALPEAETKIGSAEDIPLPDGAVDVVICAQSFHWFATAGALAEIHRVLKPGGVLGLIWNVRDERTDWVASLTAIMDPFSGKTPRYHQGIWRQLFPAKGFGSLRGKHFPYAHTGSPEQVIRDRVMSISFIAALPPAQQQIVETQLRDLIEATPCLAGKDEVTFPYETVVYSCRKHR